MKTMRVILSAIVAFTVMAGGFVGSGRAAAASPDFVGDGSAGNPYLIGTAEQLNKVRGTYMDMGTYFKLTADIDLSGYADWEPIGKDQLEPFRGNLDGDEFTITGLTINDANKDYVGLFGYLSAGSSVALLNVENATINGNQSVGVLAGYNEGGTIHDISVSGTVNGMYNAGGVVGSNADGEIRDSRSSANVIGASGSIGIGGLAGYSGGDYGLIINSYASGEVSGGNSIGGLIGQGYKGAVISSHASGKVSGKREIGGLVGSDSDVAIISSYASGEVNGDMEVGGLVGNISNSGEITSSYALGSVGGDENVGGLVGWNNDSRISDSYALGNVSGAIGRSSVGGLVGNNMTGKISESFASGNVSGTNSVGGLVGQNFTAEIAYSYALGNVNGNDGSFQVGGLVGGNTAGAISASFASGDVYGGNDALAVGGLIGYSNGGTIAESYASGEVVGNGDSFNLGGLVGDNAGEISDSYASGGVTGKDYSGGLIGYNHDVVIRNSYASGQVTVVSGSQEAGGLVGYNMSASTINSFYDKNTTGQNVSAGGSGVTTGQMLTQSTYENDVANAWDFAGIWALDTTRNGGYPYLIKAQAYLDYEGNGNDSGTGPPSQSYPIGAPARVYSDAVNLVKNGFSFFGWNTSADDSGDSYRPGEMIHLTSSATLYARWANPSSDATLSSTIGSVSVGGTSSETITHVPYGTKLSAFKTSITPAPDATYEVYDADGTTVATRLASGKKVVVTAQDGTTKVTYTVTVEANSEKAITSFSFAEQTKAATIDDSAHTVAVEVALGTDLTGLVASFALSAGATATVGGFAQTSGTTVNDFTGPVVYDVKAEDGSTQSWTVTVTVWKGAKDITSFSVPYQTKPADIVKSESDSQYKVIVEVARGTNLNGLIATFTLSPGATAKVGAVNQVSGTTPNNFTTPIVTYKVTAADGTTRDWLVIVSIAPNTENDILSFGFSQQTGPAVIDATAHTVAIEVAYGTNVTSLKATYTLSAGATAKVGTTSQKSGITINDFTNPVTYKVRAEDNTAQNWTVTVTVGANSAKAITSFSLASQTRVATINSTAHTIAIEVARGTDFSNLVATFALSVGATVKVGTVDQTSGTTANDFRSPVTYTVKAANGTTQDWVVTVTEEPSHVATLSSTIGTVSTGSSASETITGIPYGTALADFKAAITPAAGATFNVYDADGTTIATTLASGKKVIVTAQDGTTKTTYTVTVDANSAKAITTFSLASQTGAAAIDSAAHSIAIEVAHGTNLGSLIATFALSTGATAKVGTVDQTSGTTANDFRSPVTYTVKAENGSTQDWVVTVTEESSHVATLSSTIGTVSAGSSASETITGIPYGTTLADFKAAITPAAGATFNVYDADGTTVATTLASGKRVIVTAQDGTTKTTYTVTVDANSAKAITSFSLAAQTSAAMIDATAHTVAIEVTHGTNLSSIVATFALSVGATAKVGTIDQTSGTTANDFRSPVTYTVKAENGTTQDWVVAVTEEPSHVATLSSTIGTVSTGGSGSTTETITGVPYGTTLADFKAAITPAAGATFSVYDSDGTSVATVLASGKKVIVTAQDGTTKTTYTVTVDANSAKAITSFSLASQTGTATIDATAHTIAIEVVHGTNVSSLVAAFALSAGATAKVGTVDQTSGTTANDFRSPVTYTVKAENGTTQDWVVTVSEEPSHVATLSSTIGTVSTGGSGSTTETITGIPYGTTLADFKAAITPATGATFNVYDADGTTIATTLASGKKVIVTAQDGMTKTTYTVTVNPASSGGGIGGGPATPGDTVLKSKNGKLTLPAGREGEVSLDDEVIVFIPAGATDKELQVTIDKVTDAQKLLLNNEVPLSSVFELLKSFRDNFKKPVTLTFLFDPAKIKRGQSASVFYYDEEKKNWIDIKGGVITGNRITVTVDHFTKFAVLAVGQPAEEPGEHPSADLRDIAGHWAEAVIKKAVAGGIVSGYTDGTFKPNKSISRAEFAVMLMKVLKVLQSQEQGAGQTPAFTDADQIGSWAKNAVASAAQAGIVSGYTDGTFRPTAAITRAEMAVMIAKALGLTLNPEAITSFGDDKLIPSWAKGAAAEVKRLGLMEGKGANQFHPNDQATRAEAVTVLLKMLALANKTE
ncbi:S-layer homology domain-containing protein [Cohnella soli]|uniref:S-layer homology domain-containing protein n=1 Tax=Cohnella soli TaxID=425005 RepID=A0ABW0I3H1_9BACL